jgi:tetratricopeptide (TPR) repeat protein
LDEARTELEHALAGQERDFGLDSPITGDTRAEWYRLLLEMGAYAEVEAALRAALERPFNQVGPMRAYLGAMLGAACTGQGRYEVAEPLLLEGWRIVGSDERLWAINKLDVLDGLVAFYVAIEDEEQADVYRELARPLRETR